MCEICAQFYGTQGSLCEHKKQTHGDHQSASRASSVIESAYHPRCTKLMWPSIHLRPFFVHTVQRCFTQITKSRFISKLQTSLIKTNHTVVFNVFKGFVLRMLLDDHINCHLGLKPCKCILCDNSYQKKSNAINHGKKSHPHLYTIGDKVKIGGNLLQNNLHKICQ